MNPFTSRCGLTLPALLLLLLWPALAEAQIGGTLEVADLFGEATAAGDFNGDGFEDLAVGASGEDISAFAAGAGGVNVIYGTSGSGLSTAANQFWHQSSTDVEDAAESGDVFGSALAAGDFNGDGYDDLAIGVPYENVGSLADAGAVNVLYGSAAGLSATTVPDQLWSQETADVQGAPEDDDRFGNTLATGDFDGDGYDDLAIGVVGEAVGTLDDAGAANVLYGSAAGLAATGNQIWYQDITGVDDASESGDYFGSSLAAGDLDGDGFDDLAIGVPRENIVSGGAADGAVNVLYGSSGVGLTATGDQFWNQDSPGVLDVIDSYSDFYLCDGDCFGTSLAAGDFDGDGFDDLAIGVEGEGVASEVDRAGAVNVLYGSSGVGLTATGDQFWHQDSPGVLDQVEDAEEYFGTALTAGDFDGDGFDDLAVGVPWEAIGSIYFAGAVNVLYGSSSVGLTATGDQFWGQNASGVLDTSENDDFFGRSLASGDFDGDGYDDLAIGVGGVVAGASGGEDVGATNDAGAVNVLYGTTGPGLTATGDQFWRQDGTGSSLTGEVGEDALAEEATDEEAAAAPPASVVTEAPTTLALLPSSPNPFRAQATLRFTLPTSGPVQLAVYDALGRQVAVVVDETREAGEHAVAFDAHALPSGTYLVRLEAAGQALTQRITRVR